MPAVARGGSAMRVRRLLPLVPFTLLPAEWCWGQAPPAISMGGVVLGLETVTTTGGPPLALEVAPGDSSNRLFIAGQTTGRVELLKSGSTVQTTPFLSTASGGLTLSTGSEK